MLVNDRKVGFEAGADIAGWLVCSGAGLLACAKSTQPPRKLKIDAAVNHSRILVLTIFIIGTLLSFKYELIDRYKPLGFSLVEL